ncbi:MAG TPA: pyridoxamine 5'-phosphate oxidase family protein, partial [Terriglobales bacterium]|nr:pyridoxamine 5'-phosphate oxidase family protein [Terriglobales bacterium]
MTTPHTEPLLTPRTTLARHPERGTHELETIHQILDEGFVCHVGFVAEGQPYVIPTGYGRVGETVYIHGSAASRMLRNLQKGIELCLTVTLLDGLVMARSAFSHSMNYRSVVILGKAVLVEDKQEKMAALQAISEQIVPGRWAEVRTPTDQELKATSVLKLPLAEASAKIRTGGPKDPQEDISFPVWAGVLPLKLVPGTPVEDPASVVHEVPKYLSQYSR